MMRTLFELIQWLLWSIHTVVWSIYHTLHSRKLGSLIIEDVTGDFICRRCGKHFNFDVSWETRA